MRFSETLMARCVTISTIRRASFNRISTQVDAQISDFVLTKPVAGYRLDATRLELKATNEKIYVTGDARINTVPVSVKWSEKLKIKVLTNNELRTKLKFQLK